MRSRGNRHNRRSGFATIPMLAVMLGMVTTNVWAQPAQAQDTWVRITAFTDIPLADADVEVYDSAGRRIFNQNNATNSRGAFAAKIQNLPRDFRVIVSGEDGNPERKLGRLTLSTDVREFNPVRDIVYVNAVTTMVSHMIDRFPGSKLHLEQELVRRFLGLPANASLGAALRHGKNYRPRHFSHTAFLAEAVKVGGVRPFLNSLVTEIVAKPTTTRQFAPTPQVAPAPQFALAPQLASAAPQAASAAPSALLGGPASFAAKFVAEKLASGALSWAAGQGLGWAAQSAGIISPGATKADIEALQNGLADLQSSIDDLSRQIAALSDQMKTMLTQIQYSVLSTPANAMAAQVDAVANELASLAELCAPLPDDGSVAPPFSEFCKNQKASLVGQLNTHAYDYETLLTYVLDDPSQRKSGMIHLFSQFLGQSVHFFRPADSTTVQNFSDYWDAVLTQAATLKVELWHQNGAQNDPKSAVLLTNFLGNTNVNPPTQGTLQMKQAQQAQLLFPPVPIGTVIHTTNRTMWANESPITDYPNCLFWPGNAWGVSNKPQLENINRWGLPGWHSPHLEELQQVVTEAGSSPLNWLINQTKAVAPESPRAQVLRTLSGFPMSVATAGQGSGRKH